MTLSYKNRIAIYYMGVTAVIIALVFVVVYLIVRTTVYHNLDSVLSYQAKKHTKEIFIEGDSLRFVNKAEWEEREHKEVDIHPVFMQINDKDGRIMDKSPNLKDQSLAYEMNPEFVDPHSRLLGGREIRQAQIPLIKDDRVKGYILVAMSLEDAKMVLKNLKTILWVFYPGVLFALFFIARFLAGKSIVPIKQITETTNRISRKNLNERVNLPAHKDELHTLSTSINDLLQRLQETLEREKQFTSDASHELRTPLAVLKGTLEVLTRNPRSAEEYKDKINESIREIDRLSGIVDQLLLLARLEKSSLSGQQSVILVSVIDEILQRHRQDINLKKLRVQVADPENLEVITDKYYLDLILDNLISNAIKYSYADTTLLISIKKDRNQIFCKIGDRGIGIKQEDLNMIFRPFFRSDALAHKQIKGNGLGLSIVQKACELLKINLTIDSRVNSGTEVTLVF